MRPDDGPFAYIDAVDVRVSFGPYPGHPPVEVYSLVHAPPPDGGWSDEDVSDALDTVLRPPWHSEAPLPHTLDIHKHRTSWGAAGAGIQIVLYVASNATAGVVGGMAWDSVRALWERFRPRQNEAPAALPEHDHADALTREEIRAAYSLAAPPNLISDSTDTESLQWRFEYRADDGTEYTATVSPGLSIFIRRTVAPGESG